MLTALFPLVMIVLARLTPASNLTLPRGSRYNSQVCL